MVAEGLGPGQLVPEQKQCGGRVWWRGAAGRQREEKEPGIRTLPSGHSTVATASDPASYGMAAENPPTNESLMSLAPP